MEEQTKADLVFIPSPGRGHLSAALEMAKLLVDRDRRISVTVLVIKPSFDPKSTAHSYSHHFQESESDNINFVDIPQLEHNPTTAFFHVSHIIENHKSHVRDEVAKIASDTNRKLAGFVVDMFCISMIDIANEFSIPTYLFFTSGAAVLGLVLHFQSLEDYHNQDLAALVNSEVSVSAPSYDFPVPVKSLPPFLTEENGRQMLMNLARRFRQTRGILVNTFSELEPTAMRFFSEKTPPVYPVGPILSEDSNNNNKHDEIMKWLDRQPASSVVFLCFGSKGWFDETQVKEIALGLEKSGHRFLWSLRKPPGENSLETPGEYENPSDVLPEGFLRRTDGSGKVIGWAPQMAVLSHGAVGGFVSHCGWNSTLESLWCGVPMAAWPLFAEQPANAFQLVKELGVAVEISMEYRKSSDGSSNMIVRGDVIGNGIRRLMEPGSHIREKMQVLKVKSRMAVEENGSSFESVGRFINDAMVNMA